MASDQHHLQPMEYATPVIVTLFDVFDELIQIYW